MHFHTVCMIYDRGVTSIFDGTKQRTSQWLARKFHGVFGQKAELSSPNMKISVLTLVAIIVAILANCSSAKKKCVESCAGRPDGDYKASCTYDCRQYITCVFGFWFLLKCRPDHYFDVDVGKCMKGCPTGPRGILDCYDRPDGHWQHCCYCDLYATCASGGMFFHRRCEPGGPVFHDDAHKCLWTSDTCLGVHRFY